MRALRAGMFWVAQDSGFDASTGADIGMWKDANVFEMTGAADYMTGGTQPCRTSVQWLQV